MDAEKLGPFIASIRKEKGMTQAELAEKLNLSDKTISKWERGKGLPDIGNIEPLAEALAISLVELMQAERCSHETISIREAEALLSDSISMSSGKEKYIEWTGMLVLSIFSVLILFLLAVLWQSHFIALFSVGSITLGLISWSIPIWNMTQKKRLRTDTSILISLAMALTSVAIQAGQIYHDAVKGDWSSIEDTIDVLFAVIVLFSLITVSINFAMIKTQRSRDAAVPENSVNPPERDSVN